MADEVILESHRKVAQLYKAIKDRADRKYIERILRKDGNINLEFPKDCNVDLIDSNSNLLHFTFGENNNQIFRLLLNNNADFTIKNGKGLTVIHRAILEKHFEVTRNKYQNSFVDAVLSSHVRFANTLNPTCDSGLSHFHAACMADNLEAVEFFLEHGASVHQSVNADSPIFAGFTPLHFAARYSCLRIAKVLLEKGADVHSKEASGMTALNILIERKVKGLGKETEDANEKMIKLLIERDIADYQNYTGADCFGLSNLHAACVLKSISVLQRLLENVTDVNQCVDEKSPFCPGYTPLHFAALFSIEAVKLLVKKGADIEAKDANNVMPLDVCLKRYSVKNIHSVMSSKREWTNIALSDNRTRLMDVVFSMTSADEIGSSVANTESFADEIRSPVANTESFAHLSIPKNSPLWPGYTMLHLAVIFSEISDAEWPNDVERIEKCLALGADITKTDTSNQTALHLAFYSQKRRVVELLLQHHPSTANPSDNNDLSHFHIACAARDHRSVERFLSKGVDVNVPINTTVKWHITCHRYSDRNPRFFFIVPGSTALHVNIASGDVKITRTLLEHGADVYARDANGFTPIHRLLTSRTSFFYEHIHDVLLNVEGLKDSVAEGGLTHLHVASHFDNLDAVERLLGSGADIDARVNYAKLAKDNAGEDWFYESNKPSSVSSRYAGFTPLHFAVQANNLRIKEFLVANGADLFAKNAETPVPIYDILHRDPNAIIPILANNVEWQTRLRERSGLTMLHIACFAVKLEIVERTLSSSEDVNARVHVDSPIWPGCTPLHLAMTAAIRCGSEDYEELKKIVGLLLENGADVTLMNRDGDTPLHIIDTRRDRPFVDSTYVDLLLNTVKDFSVNPTSRQGVSFFHVACMKKDVAKVERYLKHRVDVNRSVGHFADRYSGCTPLHLAAGYRSKKLGDDVEGQLQTVELLLKGGADVHAKDVYDNTPLHAAAARGTSREIVFEIIIRNGGNVHAENLFGETPLEILAKSGNASWEEVSCLLKRGSRINSYNPVTEEGIIPKFFISAKSLEERDLTSAMFRQLIASDYVTEVDDEGRTFLHNLASVACSEYNRAWYRDDPIERLLARGCRINHRDVRGKTALHTAALFKNTTEIGGLFENGADVNETDGDGKTAFSYVFEKSCTDDPELAIELFAKHVHKMELCGMYVNELNRQSKQKAMKEYSFEWSGLINRFERAKRIKIGSTSMTLHDFCFDNNAEMIYSNMSYAHRQEVDAFFEKYNENNLFEMDYLCALKYKRVLEKLRLIGPAVVSFGELIKYQLPELCCRVIMSFLSSADLENVIALTT